MTDSRKFIAAGSRIECPHCRAAIATFRYDLLVGAPDIGVDLFAWADGQKRDAGSQAICFTCGTPFMRSEYSAGGALPVHHVHLHEHGWVRLR